MYPYSSYDSDDYSITNSYNSTSAYEDEEDDDDYLSNVNNYEDMKNDESTSNDEVKLWPNDTYESTQTNVEVKLWPEDFHQNIFTADDDNVSCDEQYDSILLTLKRLNAMAVILQKLDLILNNNKIVTYEKENFDRLEDLMMNIMFKMHSILQSNKL